MAKDRELVGFLIAGVQKAGTTALHSHLNAHPNLFLPSRKELHFFDDETIDWTNPDYSVYHSYFLDRGSAKIVGEATPIYSFWPSSIERVRVYNRDIKIIVMLRSPVDRAYSHWAMETARGQEVLSFSQAIREGRTRVSVNGAASNESAYRTFSYVERGFYAHQIKRLYANFPPRQIHFVKSENLKLAHHQQLDDLCSFLGVDKFEVYPEAQIIRPPVPKKDDLAPLSINDRLFLSSLFEEDISETAQLTGLDLSSWTSGQENSD